MRIDELRLLAIGPFTDVVLDLSAGTEGLHLIWGGNEAGKSSALRAIGYLLYGFPARTSDDFLHSYANLRVGARLRDKHGGHLDVTRRKTQKKSLRDGSDEEEVPESRLREFLGHASEDVFRRSFGIDHEQLVHGGAAIVRGEGDLGPLLFSGAGIAQLRQVEDSLADDIGALFTPRGQKPIINHLLSRLKAVRKEAKEKELRPDQWERHFRSLEDARKRKQALEEKRIRRQRDRDRLQRFQAALPMISKLADLEAEWEELQHFATLPADFDQRRETAVAALGSAQTRLAVDDQEISRYEEQLAKIHIPPELSDAEAQLKWLEQHFHRYEDAQEDRPAVAAKLAEMEQQMTHVLKELSDELSLEDAERMLLPLTERRRIQQLGAEFEKLREQNEQLGRAIEETDRQLEAIGERLASAPAVVDPQSLADCVTQSLLLGNAEEQLAELEAWLADEQAKAEREAARLRGWSGTLEELAAAPVPDSDAIEELIDLQRAASDDLSKTQEQLELARRDLEDNQAAIRGLQAERDIPTLEQLNETRRRRDIAWRRLRDRWSDAANSEHPVAELLESAASHDLPLEDVYETLVKDADILADRLRNEADRVAQHAQMQAELDKAARRCDRLEQQLEENRRRLQSLEEQWQNSWRQAGVKPGMPREMRGWLERYRTIVQNIEQLARKAKERDELTARVDVSRESLCNALTQAHVTVPKDAPFQAIRQLAQESLESLRQQQQERRELEREHERLTRLRDQSERERAAIQKRLQSWHDQWEEASARLPEKASRPSDADLVMDLLNQLSKNWELANMQRTRLEEIDAFSRDFAEGVESLAKRAAPDIVGQPVGQQAQSLLERFRSSCEQQREQRRLQRELARRKQQRRQHEMEWHQAQDAINQLCQEATCDDADALRAAWERSQRKTTVRHEMDRLRDELRARSGGLSLSEFIADAKKQDPDALPLEIERLDEEIRVLEHTLIDEVGQTIGQEEEALRHMRASCGAAAATEDERDLTAELIERAREYAVLRTAQLALTRAIESYRQRHQGPVLSMASNFFARLTCGSFEGLKADYDASGQPVLMGLRRSTQQVVPVSGMSDGTADQLYLALRCAWLVHYLNQHEPLPLIVDDILIRFDDERASETLRVLAELSSQTQVLFFTHHRHLVDLAQRLLAPDALFVHSLGV